MSKSTLDTRENRYVYIDILRIIACFMVIVNHTNSSIFLNSTPDSRDWWLSLTWFYMSKPAVPLFVMISGFTMVDKQDSYKKCLSRAWRMLVVLVCFSGLYYIQQYLDEQRAVFSLADFLTVIYKTNITNAYWYLYFYIGLLIAMPFVQKFVTALSKRDIEIFIVISVLISSVWPVLTHYASEFGNNMYIDLGFFNIYAGILLIGYYFKKYVVKKRIWAVLAVAAWAACLAFNVMMTGIEYEINGGQNYLFLDNRVYIPILMQSVAIFYLVSYGREFGRFSNVISTVGKCTFGIYLLSDLLIYKSGPVLGAIWVVLDQQMLSMVVYEIVIFFICFVITYLLRLIPGVKKYV